MRKKRPHVASPDEIRITPEGETAIIEYAEPDIWATQFTIGPTLAEMTDADVLQMWNDCIETTERFRSEYPYMATEIPIGKPQVAKCHFNGTWVPWGDVLRCVIDDGGPDEEPTIAIDDQDLSWTEVGQLVTTHGGWGMRIVFVPDDELHDKPRITRWERGFGRQVTAQPPGRFWG